MKVIFASALLCCSLAAYAENEVNADTTTDIKSKNLPVENIEAGARPFNLVLAAGLTFGGDDLRGTTDGQTIEAGGLIYLAAGGVYHATPNFDLQATFGYHFDTLEAIEGTLEFTRTFFELIPFYVMDNGHRFGVGFTQIMSPEYSDPQYRIPFKDTNGVIVEYDWMLAKHFFLGFRYADITYNDVLDLLQPVDGSYFGVIMQGHF